MNLVRPFFPIPPELMNVYLTPKFCRGITLWRELYQYFGVMPHKLIEAQGTVGVQEVSNHVFDLNSQGENQLVKIYKTWGKLQNAGEPLILTLEG